MTLSALGSCMCTCHAASPLVVVQTAKDSLLLLFFFLARPAHCNERGQIQFQWKTVQVHNCDEAPGVTCSLAIHSGK